MSQKSQKYTFSSFECVQRREVYSHRWQLGSLKWAPKNMLFLLLSKKTKRWEARANKLRKLTAKKAISWESLLYQFIKLIHIIIINKSSQQSKFTTIKFSFTQNVHMTRITCTFLNQIQTVMKILQKIH